MTDEDEYNFSKLLREHLPDVYFIEISIWKTPTPPIYDSYDPLAKCHEYAYSDAAIINQSILSFDDYKDNYVFPRITGETYTGSYVGEGLIQFLLSREATYAPGCLSNGKLAASYNPTQDRQTDKFVKTVWKFFKKGAGKLYFVDQETGQIAEKPETRFIAWPDAAKKFNGENGHYLSNHAFTYFVAK